MEAKTTALAAVKQDVRLQEWSAQIEAQQASGLTVLQWCTENGVKPKTYYYRLKKVREQFLNSSPAIVPLSLPQQSADIRIEKNGLPAGQQVYLVTGYTDLRRSIDGLAMIVQS